MLIRQKTYFLIGLWFLMLFVLYATPQIVLAKEKGQKEESTKNLTGPSANRTCLNLGRASILVSFTDGCPRDPKKVKFFTETQCQGKRKNPDILSKAVTVYSSGIDTGGVLECRWNAKVWKVNPYWYVYSAGGNVACTCYDFTNPLPYTCDPEDLNNPPANCSGN